MALSIMALSLGLIAQPSAGGYPLGLSGKLHTQPFAVKLPQTNNQALLDEDREDAAHGEKSLRFAVHYPVQIRVGEVGSWEHTASGRSVWTARIYSPSARAINMVFDEFRVPQGTRMFVYSEDGQHVLGAFTEANMNRLGNFATLPVMGNAVMLELSVPQGSEAQVRVTLSTAGHVYRDFYKELKDFGDAGSCNNNVVCPEGDPWEAQIRSACMLLTGNQRYCSGAAINNTANDGTPYVLTANHCDPSATDIFMFNYFSPNCSPSADGLTSDVVQGCTIRARNAGSDFCLVELASPFPAEYNVYLSGWSREDGAPDTTVCIHHPSGDVKKITFNYDGTEVANWGNPQANCWHIFDWEDGTTEPGSSGSPLYNSQHQIIGQLYGGTADCGNNIDDYFGRLVTSWSGATANVRLQDWLDPLQQDVASITGLESAIPQHNLDASLQSITSPVASYCNVNSIEPIIKVRNAGANTLVAFTLSYGFTGTTALTYDWTGSLATNQSVTLTLPSMPVNPGSGQVFQASVLAPNGGTDEAIANNSSLISVDVNQGAAYSMRLVPDNYPEEIGFVLTNLTTNQTVMSVPAGSVSGATVTYPFCLADGCYRFVITDTEGDGICCGFFTGNGSYTVYDEEQGVLGTGGNYNSSDTVLFCVGNVGIETLWNQTSALKVFPNPAMQQFVISVPEAIVDLRPEYEIINAMGQRIQSGIVTQTQQQVAVEAAPAGMYFIRVRSALGVKTQRIVLQ